MRFLYIIGLLIVFGITQNQCMDKKYQQQQIVLHLPDGNNFPIDTYKIPLSGALYTDYLRRKQLCAGRVTNMALFYSDVNSHEMKLYSQALEWNPGLDFEKHFNLLSREDQRALIIVAGQYGENPRQKKLHSPALIAQLCDVCFNGKGFDSTYIKPRMEGLSWWYYCMNTMMKNNLPQELPDGAQIDFAFKYTDAGLIKIVPKCLIDGSYDGSYNNIVTPNNDKEFVTKCIKSIDDVYDYRLTTDTRKKDDNKCLLHCVNRTTHQGTSVEIEHKDPITHVLFSPSGEYLCTYSKDLMLVSKITRKENDKLFVTSLPIPLSAPCLEAFFNKESTALITSCWNKDNHQGALTLWDISSGNACVKKFEKDTWYLTGICGHNKLLTMSHDNNVGTAVLWDTTNLSNIVPRGTLNVTETDFWCAACSPNGEKWAAVTQDGQLILLVDTGDKVLHKKKELKDSLYGSIGKFPRILYSPDNLFLAVLYPNKNNCNTLNLYSARTDEKLGSWQTTAQGVGFTQSSTHLLLDLGDDIWTKMQLLRLNDYQNLKYLFFDTSIHQLAVLRRLAEAYRNNDTIELYKSDYKALQLLPNNLPEVVEKSLFIAPVISNKEVPKMSNNLQKIIENWCKNI